MSDDDYENEIDAAYDRNRLRVLIPALETIVSCPVVPDVCYHGNYVPRPILWNMIQHLNDVHEWTREQIADWLEASDLDLTIQDRRKK
jgi:hypothetical protein